MGEQYLEVHKSDLHNIGCFYDRAKTKLALSKYGQSKSSSLAKPVSVLKELTVLSILRDRLKSSRNNKHFQNEEGRAYVILTYKEIIKRLNYTERTCTKILNDLKDKGIISEKKTIMGPTKYFVETIIDEKSGYYKLYYKYFDEFNNDLNHIYAYMFIKDLMSLSVYTTLNNNKKYKDENGKYFVRLNASRLSKTLRISLPTANKTIKYLENNGYIKRKRRKNSPSQIYLINDLNQ